LGQPGRHTSRRTTGAALPLGALQRARPLPVLYSGRPHVAWVRGLG
jgi:hypothetical protein